MAHSVEYLTPDFGSGHDLRVVGLSPVLGSALGMEPAWDSISLSLSLSLSLSVSLSLPLPYCVCVHMHLLSLSK